MHLHLANTALLSSSEVTFMMTVEDVLGSPPPKPICLDCLSAKCLRSRERHPSYGWIRNPGFCHCQSTRQECSPQQNHIWPKPDLCGPSQLWNIGYVSELSFPHLEERSGHNLPKCYEEECLVYSRCSINVYYY